MSYQSCFGCPKLIPTTHLVCRTCWDRIPRPLQSELYRTWNRGKPLVSYWQVREQCIQVVSEGKADAAP